MSADSASGAEYVIPPARWACPHRHPRIEGRGSEQLGVPKFTTSRTYWELVLHFPTHTEVLPRHPGMTPTVPLLKVIINDYKQDQNYSNHYRKFPTQVKIEQVTNPTGSCLVARPGSLVPAQQPPLHTLHLISAPPMFPGKHNIHLRNNHNAVITRKTAMAA